MENSQPNLHKRADGFYEDSDGNVAVQMLAMSKFVNVGGKPGISFVFKSGVHTADIEISWLRTDHLQLFPEDISRVLIARNYAQPPSKDAVDWYQALEFTVPEPAPEPAPEPKAEPEPAPEPAPEPKAEPAPEPKAEPAPEPKAEPEPNEPEASKPAPVSEVPADPTQEAPIAPAASPEPKIEAAPVVVPSWQRSASSAE